MYRFFLVGQPNLRNRGCEALTMCTADLIRRAVGACTFEATSDDIDYDSADMGNWPTRVRFVPASNRRSMYTTLKGLGRRLHLCAPCPPNEYWARNLHKYFSRADVVVSIGGDLFSEDYGIEQPMNTVGQLNYAQRLGKQTLVWAASIGPFNNQELLDYTKQTFRNVDLITVRERHSLDYMRNLGLKDNVKLTADPAFHLERRDTPRTRLPIFESGKTIIGIGISDGIYKFSHIAEAEYSKTFAAFADELVDRYDANICLIPHVMTRGGSANDDEARCRSVIAKVKQRDRVVTFDGVEMRAGELKEIIARCDYHIGARTHSTIAALSSYVPTIAIAFSRKAWAIFEDVYGHTNYVVDGNSITVETLLNTFELLFSNRKSVVQTLRKRVPELKVLSEKGATHLAAILRR